MSSYEFKCWTWYGVKTMLILFPRIFFSLPTTYFIINTSIAGRRPASSMYASSAKNVINTSLGVGTISGLKAVSNSHTARCPTSWDDSANPMESSPRGKSGLIERWDLEVARAIHSYAHWPLFYRAYLRTCRLVSGSSPQANRISRKTQRVGGNRKLCMYRHVIAGIFTGKSLRILPFLSGLVILQITELRALCR